jgi:hypothetical protein
MQRDLNTEGQALGQSDDFQSSFHYSTQWPGLEITLESRDHSAKRQSVRSDVTMSKLAVGRANAIIAKL